MAIRVITPEGSSRARRRFLAIGVSAAAGIVIVSPVFAQPPPDENQSPPVVRDDPLVEPKSDPQSPSGGPDSPLVPPPLSFENGDARTPTAGLEGDDPGENPGSTGGSDDPLVEPRLDPQSPSGGSDSPLVVPSQSGENGSQAPTG